MSPDGQLPEIVERPDHPWFIGVQFHPELKSRPFEPHPLFAGFIEAAVKQIAASSKSCSWRNARRIGVELVIGARIRDNTERTAPCF